LSYAWLPATDTLILNNQFFPVHVQGTVNGTVQTIDTVVELPPAGGGSGTGVMALSKIRLGEGVDLLGDLVLLQNGDQYHSVHVGKNAVIKEAEDGSGGRILLRDKPDLNLDLRPKPNGNMPPILDDDTLQPLDPPVPLLTGILGNIPQEFRNLFPVITHGDNVQKPVKDRFLQELSDHKGVAKQTLADFVKDYLTSPVDPLKKIMDLNTFLVNERHKSSEEADAYLEQMDRFVLPRTPPNYRDPLSSQVDAGITVGGQKVNRGGQVAD